MSRERELATPVPSNLIMPPNPPPRARSVPFGLWSRLFWMVLILLIISGETALHAQPPPPVQAQVGDTASIVRGRVEEHETGRALAGAAVSLASGPGGTEGIGTRVTDSEGGFVFRQVPPGRYRIIVTLIGYRDLRDTLEVGPESDLELVLPLSVSPIPLEPLVVVSERRDRGVMADFERRRRTRSGTFIDRAQIETRQPYLFTDLLRMVPGARVIPTTPYGYTVRLRGNCRPELWVDGMRLLTAEGIDEILPTMDVEAVEVYHSSSLPVEFGSSDCGAIVVWTRRGDASAGQGGFWRKLAFATGFAVLALLLAR